MKYFTPAWHRGDLDDEASDRVWGDYQRHLAGLLPGLPPEVQALATDISIHDGLLWKAEADPEHGSLRLALRCGDLQVGYFDLELEYEQVDFVPELAQALRKLSVVKLEQPSKPYPNEALYDELDQEGDLLVHRILFLCDAPRQRQARRRMMRQRRHDVRRRKRDVWFMRNNYLELTVRFKELRLKTTPREGRSGRG